MRAYLLLFFAFLFAPLIIMSVTAFNASPFPRVWPWDCLTLDWFIKAAFDARLKQGLLTSAVIAFGVVLLAVPLGLAGALMLTQVWPEVRGPLYIVLIAPILIPGVVLGVSTFLFWRRLEMLLGLAPGSPFSNGIFLTIVGQSCYIASYCMLVFMARLQRFDYAQLDAALDLGASPFQAFRRVLLPFLRPAIGAAIVLACLSSFENYGTTVFTIGRHYTFTTEIAQRARLGVDPTLSAIAVALIIVSLIFIFANEAGRWQSRRAQEADAQQKPLDTGKSLPVVMGVALLMSALLAAGATALHFTTACSVPGVSRPIHIPMDAALEDQQPAEGGAEDFLQRLQLPTPGHVRP